MLGSSHPEVFCKKVTLRSFAKFIGKHLCQSLFFKKVAGSLKRFQHVFSCEFSENCRGDFFADHMQMATSECSLFHNFSEKKRSNWESKRETCIDIQKEKHVYP